MSADTVAATYQERPAWVEAFWRYARYVTVRADDMTGRRVTDAGGLTFPLQLVVLIIGGIVATTGAFWVSTSQIRSDVRDMATQRKDDQRLHDLEQRLSDERYDALLKQVTAVVAAQRLEEIRNQEMRVTIAAIGSGAKK